MTSLQLPVMAKLRITNEKTGQSWFVEDNHTTRKSISSHNKNAREGEKWLVDGADAPPRLTKDQELAALRAENASLKAAQSIELDDDSPQTFSKDYDAERAIALINLFDTAAELTEFCKGEKRVTVKEAREQKLKTLNP